MSILAEIDEDDPTKIRIAEFEWRYKTILNSVPSAHFNSRKNYWTYSLTWQTCLALQTTLRDKLTVGPNLKKWMFELYNNVIAPAYGMRMEITPPGWEEVLPEVGLYPHQKGDVAFLSTVKRGMLFNGMGSGKAQPVSEPVLTPHGWVPMGELSIGDQVIGSNGSTTTVTAVHPQGVRDVYKVTMKDGSFTYCDINHLWDVRTIKDDVAGMHRILTTKDLIQYGVAKSNGTLKFKVPLVSPVEFPKKDLAISPYIMGAVLGDGSISSSRVSLCNADQEILDRVNSELPEGVILKKVADSITYSFHNLNYKEVRKSGGDSTNPILSVFSGYGLVGAGSREKFIPVEYKYSSVEDRIDLLHGLMDTDGTTSGNVHSFCTVSLQLAYDVREVVQSLGGTAVWSYHKRPKLGNYDPIVITIRLPEGINPFFVSRKASKVLPNTKYKLSRFISSIEFSHREESKCISVDADDRLYVTRDYIVTHNSISSMSAVKMIAEQGNDVFPMLIACPNSTKMGWKKEINKVWPGLKINVIDGTATQRRKLIEEEGVDVIIINWESIRGHSKLKPYGSIALKRCMECKGLDDKIKATACEAHAKELNMIDFKTVIGDEIHRIKDPKSKTARAFKAATGDATYRIGLSGTPIASSPEDLFSPLNWLFPEAYPSKNKYIDRFCLTADSAWGGKIVIGVRPEMEQEFFSGIDPFTRRMSKEVILPFLPPIVYQRRDVEMAAKQKKAYEQMRDKMIAEVTDGEVVYTTSPLTKMTRMLQFSSAYAEIEYRDIYDQVLDAVVNKPYVRLSDPSCKLDAFMEDLEDYGDESIVVFAVSSQLINMLSARLDKLKIPHGLITGDQDATEREFHMENFQAGKTKMILCTIAAGGTGITLTKGSTAVFLQRSWSMIENQQAEARVHRIGSEVYDHIRIVDYVTKGSVEELVFKAVEEKSNQLEVILRDRELMEKFLKGELSEKPPKKEEND